MRYFDRVLSEELADDPSGDNEPKDEKKRASKRDQDYMYDLAMRWKNLRNEYTKAKESGNRFEKEDEYYRVEEEMKEYVRKYPEDAQKAYNKVLDMCPDKEQLREKLTEIYKTSHDNLVLWMLRHLINKAGGV